MQDATLAQRDREMLVATLLDITLEQFDTWLHSLSDEQIDSIPSEVQERITPLVESLRLETEPDQRRYEYQKLQAGQQYIQSIALMSDSTLLSIIVIVTGTNPLEA